MITEENHNPHRSKYIWVDDQRDKKGKGRIWVCYGSQQWPSHCDWMIPGTFDIYA